MADSLTSRSSIWISAVLSIMILMATSTSTVESSGDHGSYLGWVPIRSSPSSSCKGSISECLASNGGTVVGEEEEEFQMDSEISRRILATTNYISYGALQRNTVPCSRRGASYYNCQPGAQANPYSRGCSAITRCRS
ncbi:rapid alkalinization factor [Euphorbia lathyris]|uniref:rapid alkalinization factor n=1 Tax=Euphorbia lathyris TaxID=212925 RepID=UPI0033130FBA